MHIVAKEEMKQVEKRAIEEYGIKEIVLMENAGRVVAKTVLKFLPQSANNSVFIAAGTGNNGGDAFVTARYLLNEHVKVQIFVIGNMAHMTESAKINYQILEHMHAKIYYVATSTDWDKVKLALNLCTIVVDGLCGTGIRLPLRKEQSKMVEYINQVNKKVIAVDIPSGVDADTGEVCKNIAIKAVATVTMGLIKIGLCLYPGASYAGQVVVDDIGIAQDILRDDEIKQTLINLPLVKELLPKRSMQVYKSTCGRVLVLAGSMGFTGAAALCSRAALNTGAGLVTLAAAKSLYPIFAQKLTEVIVKALPEVSEGIVGLDAIKLLIPREESYDTVLIGPGLGRNEKTMEFVRQLAVKIKKPLVLDADAIFAFAGRADELKKCAFTPILTPHLGEMANLLQIKVKDLKKDLWQYARQSAIKYHCVFILKSEKTIVACPDGRIFLTTVGNPGMATAGCGDVLAGVTAALRADNMNEVDASIAAVFIHGKAGDIAARRGMAGLLAGNIADNIQVARKFVVGK